MKIRIHRKSYYRKTWLGNDRFISVKNVLECWDEKNKEWTELPIERTKIYIDGYGIGI